MAITYVSRIAREKGLKIVDATTALDIGVGVDDIVKAKTRNSKCCAFARATKRNVRGVRAAYFFRRTAFLEFDDRIERYEIGAAATREIVSFDRSGIMAPGKYRIAPPAPTRSRAKLAEYAASYWGRVRDGIVSPPAKKAKQRVLIVNAKAAKQTGTSARARRAVPWIRTLDEPR